VVGAGFVGLTTAVVMAERGHSVALVEIDQARVDHLLGGNVPFHEPGLSEAWRRLDIPVLLTGSLAARRAQMHADATVLCVPTPTSQAGAQVPNALWAAAKEWATANSGKDASGILVIRSTVIPPILEMVAREMQRVDGMGERTRLAHVPEFLAEGTALDDTRHPHRLVIGWASGGNVEQKQRDTDTLIYLFASHEPAWSPECPMFVTTLATAAMVKYSSNTMLASRLSTLQTLAGICEASGADMDVVSRALATDDRIGSKYLQACAGWGGSCFPKDVSAIAAHAREIGVGARLLTTIIQTNRDDCSWPVMQMAQCRESPLRVAWLGLSFKPGTSDTRESPSVQALTVLLHSHQVTKQLEVRAHDPQAEIPDFRLSEPVQQMASAIDAARGANVLVLATAWPQYRTMLPALLAVMDERPLIIDCRGLWSHVSPADLPDGAEYRRFGAPPIRR